MKISTGPVSHADALRFADEVETALSEVAAGTRKAGKVPLEPVCRLIQFARDSATPIDMVLHCPKCGEQHIDEPEQPPAADLCAGNPEDVWTNPPHRSHLCKHCGFIWRPADVATNGVAAVKTRGKDDDPIVTPKPRVPDWDAIKDKRMCDLTPAQQDDAQELWIRKYARHFNDAVKFLLRRLDEARGVK